MALACGTGMVAEAKKKVVVAKHQKVKVTTRKAKVAKARKTKRSKGHPA